MESDQMNVNKEATSTVSQEPQYDMVAANDYSYAPEFDEWIKEKPKRSYIRLKNPGDSVIIRLKSGRPERKRMDNFKGKAPKPVPVYTYPVTTPDKPGEEEDFDVTSKRLARDIQAYFDKGFAELEITRLDTNPVSYRVIPMIARQQQ
jgi:hypothetical protein